MRLGIFAKTFQRRSVDEVFSAVRESDIASVQFNLACAGLNPLPDEPIPAAVSAAIRAGARRHGIELCAVSGTFNMAHPDVSVRREGLRRLNRLLQWTAEMDIPLVTLCSGTRDTGDMWRSHPENVTQEAWQDMLETLISALGLAARMNVTLAIEPEPANVISNAHAAVRLLQEINDNYLQFILDPANLVQLNSPTPDQRELSEAVELLRGHIALVHAKDRRADGSVCPAGLGVVQFRPFLERVQAAGYDGPIVIHGVGEHEVPLAVRNLRSILPGESAIS
jgi:sugar phosphate isomerase/epimerase